MQGLKKRMLVVLFILCGVFLFAPRKPLSVPDAILAPSAKIIAPDGVGAGVIISDQYILTAAHNLLYAGFFNPDSGRKIPDEDIKVRLLLKSPKGNVPIELGVKTILFDREHDLALLRVKYTFNNPAKFPLFGNGLYEGCPLWVIGAPYGLSQKLVTFGWVAEEYPNHKVVCSFTSQASNVTYKGNSGGGVYNANTNELVGILVCGRGWVSEYVPLPVILEFLERLEDPEEHYEEEIEIIEEEE